MSASLSFEVVKGEDVIFNGTHTVSASDSTPVDISGWTIVVTIRRTLNGDVVYTTPASLILGTAGTYTWSISHLDTDIDTGGMYIDIWRTDSGAKREMGSGRFLLNPCVLYGR